MRVSSTFGQAAFSAVKQTLSSIVLTFGAERLRMSTPLVVAGGPTDTCTGGLPITRLRRIRLPCAPADRMTIPLVFPMTTLSTMTLSFTPALMIPIPKLLPWAT